MKRIACILAFMLSVVTGCGAKVERYAVEVAARYPHDRTAYTQGLFFRGSDLIESTGGYGNSALRVVDLQTGKASKTVSFKGKYFGEGSVIFADALYVLTWTNKLVFVYDPQTLEYRKSFSYPREGWGLTTDGECLIASDGSARLFFMDENLAVKRTLDVKMDGRSVHRLNELEYIDGRIWANVYLSDLIVIIDPADGHVCATVDCTGLLPAKLRRPDTDVLNGIAYDCATGKIYLTGKNWPELYEIRLKPLK